MARPAAGQKVRAADFDGHASDVETANDTSSSTTYITGTSHGAAFVAPTSGAVTIWFGGLLGSNHTVLVQAAVLTLQVRTGSTVGSGTIILAASDGNGLRYYKASTAASTQYAEVGGKPCVLTGLTPGADYNVQTLYRSTVAATAGVANRWLTVEPAYA